MSTRFLRTAMLDNFRHRVIAFESVSPGTWTSEQRLPGNREDRLEHSAAAIITVLSGDPQSPSQADKSHHETAGLFVGSELDHVDGKDRRIVSLARLPCKDANVNCC